ANAPKPSCSKYSGNNSDTNPSANARNARAARIHGASRVAPAGNNQVGTEPKIDTTSPRRVDERAYGARALCEFFQRDLVGHLLPHERHRQLHDRNHLAFHPVATNSMRIRLVAGDDVAHLTELEDPSLQVWMSHPSFPRRSDAFVLY